MNWNNESIAAAGTFIALVMGAIGALVAALRKSNTENRAANSALDITDANARMQSDHAQFKFIVEQWRLLYEETHNKIDAVRSEHLDCKVELATVRTQLHELIEWKKTIESRSGT